MRDTTEATRRAIGAFVPRRSTLRRRSDRIEVATRWVLLLLGLMLLPVALSIGSEVTARLQPQVAVQQAERHHVTAQVVAAPDPRTTVDRVDTGARPEPGTGDATAPVRWIAADGTPRVSVVRVPSDARPGDPRVLWVDAQDRPTVAPMTPGYPAAQGFLTSVFIVLCDLVLSLLLLAGLHWVLDRARLRAWDEAWRRFTGPDHESRH